jgi:hypothetical protein
LPAVLPIVVETGGPPNFARVAVMQALYPPGAPVYHASRKDPRWGRRKLRER